MAALLTLVIPAIHLFGLDLGGGALATEQTRLGLAFRYLVLALHMYVGLAHATLDALTGVT